MRRFLVIIMIFLLPFQAVWAAAATYCQHEQGATVKHFGHHVHKHQGKTLKGSSETAPDTKNIFNDDDTDCASCHMTSVTPVMQTAVWLNTDICEPQRAALNDEQPPYLPNSIERPKWILAA